MNEQRDDLEQSEMTPEDTLPRLNGPPPAPPQETEAWAKRHPETYASAWMTSFHLVDPVPLFPHPYWVGVPTTADPSYRCEGRLRAGEHHCYFCCTLAGEGVFSDRRGGHRRGPGQCFLMEINDPNAAYFYPPDARTPWRFLAFTFGGLAAQTMVRALTARRGACYTLDPQAPVLRRLAAYAPPGGGLSTHNLSASEGAALVLDLLTALVAAAEDAEDVGTETALVRRAAQEIATRAVEGLRVAELAAELGVSREHLTRAFQRQQRQSPLQAIRAQRMRQARLLLRETDTPVAQVAASVGYPDVTNFVHAFRQASGVTPHQFRRHGLPSAPNAADTGG